MWIVRCLSCITLLSGIALSDAKAADKSGIGFNETWVSGFNAYSGTYCQDCPTNYYPASLEFIETTLTDLALNQHVETFREIIPVALLQPSAEGLDYGNILKVLELYSKLDVKLILSIGLPLPSYMTVTGSVNLVMPTDDQSWTSLKDSLSFAFSNLVKAMWTDPAISQSWMSQDLFIEGFNEFDSVLSSTNTTSYSTPTRAADLENGIATVIQSYGITVRYAMPSVSGSFSGYPAGTDTRSTYIADYYAAYGTGLPNVHIYAPVEDPVSTYIDVVNAVRANVELISNILPAAFRGGLILGETGNADATSPYCPGPNGTAYTIAIDPNQRSQEYAAMASDPVINKDVSILTFWRLMKLNPVQVDPEPGSSPVCEPYYGIIESDGSYNQVGLNLFNYLKN